MNAFYERLAAGVGGRVVVRLRTREGATDVLGTLLSIDAERGVIRTHEGREVAFAVGAVITGKPVPPRASVRHRVGAEEVQRRLAADWPAAERRELGQWTLRADSGFSRRANSALALGDPGVAAADASAAIGDFAAERGIRPLAQVVAGAPGARLLAEDGWVALGAGGCLVMLASTATAARRLGRPGGGPAVEIGVRAHPQWLALAYEPAPPPEGVALLERAGDVGFLSLPGAGACRISYAAEWGVLSCLRVRPERRGAGHARSLLRAAARWAGERGAGTLALAVATENGAAIGLYESVGFRTHHRYGYLVPGPGSHVAPGTERTPGS